MIREQAVMGSRDKRRHGRQPLMHQAVSRCDSRKLCRPGRGWDRDRGTERKRRELGQSLVELTLVLPVLLIILAGLLDVGRLYHAYVAVTDAAAEGARYASMNPSATADQIKRRASAASGGLILIDEDQVGVDPLDPSSSESVTVTVTYPFEVVTPLVNAMVPGGTIPLRAVVVESR